MVAAIEKWKTGIPKMKAHILFASFGFSRCFSWFFRKSVLKQARPCVLTGTCLVDHFKSLQAKVISQQDFENFLEKSKTHLVFVKNLPEDCN